jgi:DNA-binding transcriptional ArsR family regulator
MATDASQIRDIERQAAFFQSLADATRLKLMRLLSAHSQGHALCVGALAMRLGVSQSAVSQHLRVLKSQGLVMWDRRGPRVHYSIDSARLNELWESAGSLLNAGSGNANDDNRNEHCEWREHHVSHD